jgi:hypothetical protein
LWQLKNSTKKNSTKESDEERRRMRAEMDDLKFRLKVIEDATGFRVHSLKQPTVSANAGPGEDA